MTTLAEIKEAVESVYIKFQERYDRNVLTQGEPIKDSMGRLHAPFDGYEWEGIVYLGGQFLATNSDEVAGEELKIKIATFLLPELEKIFSVQPGTPWTHNGVTVCYAYAMVPKQVKTSVMKLLPEGGKKIVKVSEYGNPNNQKTWKFSDAKAFQKFDRIYADWEALFPGVGLHWEQGRKVKGKLKEFFTDFDKQEVRYLYLDNTIYQ